MSFGSIRIRLHDTIFRRIVVLSNRFFCRALQWQYILCGNIYTVIDREKITESIKNDVRSCHCKLYTVK